MGAIIIDTETTGIDEPDVIELAWLRLSDEFPVHLSEAEVVGQMQRFKPRKPISLGAMAAHNIIEHDLKDKPEWPGLWLPPDGVTYLIGHNVDYDWKAIGSPDVRRICTLALARRLYADLDSHSLAAMTYYILPQPRARDALKDAHSAMADSWLCYRLLQALTRAMPMIVSWDQLWAASEKARVPVVFDFGKYGPEGGRPGRPIAEVRQMDPSYIDWCLTKCDRCKDEYWQRALRGQI